MHSALGTGHIVAGRYRLLDQVGRGAMGIVWRGRDELLDRDVAIKQIVLTPMASATEARASYERTLREARTAARLSHPGVVTVFDVVEEDGSPWIVMELVRARPLDQVIAEDGPLPPARAAQLGLGLLEALTTAHTAGVLHRDVKPSNVLINTGGKAVLTDFGIAMVQGDPGLTQAGMVVGTPGFSPPERVRGEPATRASDLWSLGATLYAAVEGRGPFDRAGGSAAIVASIATEPAPRAPSAGPLAPVIEALLKADPAQRPDAATTARMLTQAWRTARTAGRVGVQASHLAVGQGGKGSASPAMAGSEATTATQVVSVPEAGGADGERQGGLAAASADSHGSDSLIGVAAAPAGAAVSVVPDLMATPNFADLKMPTGTAPAGETLEAGGLRTEVTVAGGPAVAPTDPAGRPPSPPSPHGKPDDPGGRGDRDSKASEFLKKRGVVALAPVVALAIAAAIVYAALPNIRTPLERLVGGGSQASQGQVAAGPGGHHVKGAGPQGGHSADSGSGGAGSGTSGKPAPGRPSSSGQPKPSGKPSASGKPKPSGKPSSGHPSTSPSSSTTPTPSPDPTPSSSSPPAGGQPPTGDVWDRVTASSVGTIAGFRIAAPAAWVMTPGLNTVIKAPKNGVQLDINMATWAVAGPVKEAKRLQAAAKANNKYPNYQLGSITATRFRGRAAARWTFSWQSVTALHPTDVTKLLFTVQTYEGPQQYIMSISAPSPHAASALSKFQVATRTFKALPF
ncbi:MAG TPA: protein kinase [Streptosporangiaceae bacterium]|nr:protein kinase [Streptosporangiaceae bacterium]